MKKKLASILVGASLCVSALALFMACGETDTTPPPVLPTKAEVVAARQNAVNETVQGYDFTLSFTGNFSALGISASASGKYDGAYRYNSATNEVSFKRTTSGALLYDSTAYVFTSGDSRIKMTMDKNGSAVKKLSVEVPAEQNVTMVNLPVVALVDSVKEANIGNITALKNSGYSFSCPLQFDNNSSAGSVLNQVFEKLGTGVSFKGIQLKANASTLDFNLKDDKVNDFHFGFQMEVDVKATKVALSVEYTQRASSTSITPPNTANISYTAGDILSDVTTINAAIADLKDDPVYSLDLTAVNEFDPGWNKTATKDSYTARMYKNTVDGNAWFNHSFKYKAHSEADGKETYKYTLGNVNGKDEDNQGTWLISRKGSNTQTRENGVTADTQFDFLTSMVKLGANEIDCIKKQTKGSETTYTVHLGRAGTQSVQQKIINMINTNPYDSDVIPVNNYFNTDNIVKDALIEITLTNGKITSIECETELCYTPTGGDYTEYNITLNNTIELQVNKNYDKAAKYEAPTKVKGTLNIGNNLNDTNNYIL